MSFTENPGPFRDPLSEGIGFLAEKAMLEEVYTFPKPGLVDLYSNGAHTDMDVRSFERSASALRPWFEEMAEEGVRSVLGDVPAPDLFRAIRPIGMRGEADMLAATGGVNTHKGLIFTMGIYSAAAGRLLAGRRAAVQPETSVTGGRDRAGNSVDDGCRGKEQDRAGGITAEELRNMQLEMTTEVLRAEIMKLQKKEEAWHSHGEDNLHKYGATGVRGEALAGYPALWEIAVPVMMQGMREGRDWNLVKLHTLMTVMCTMEDSNVLSRQDPETLREVQQLAADFMERGGAYAPDALDRLRDMDEEFIRRNISPGGCADILASAIFICYILNMK